MNDQKLSLDDREIRCIGWLVRDELETVRVGSSGITKIDCVEQFCGEYSIHWIQAWKGNKVVVRYNARNIDSIFYEGSWYE